MYPAIFTTAKKLKALLKSDRQFSIFNDLAQEQYLPRERLNELQLERFRNLAGRAMEKSGFFRERLQPHKSLLKEIRFTDQLQNIPLMTRDDLQLHSEQILCPVDDTVYADSSGGSTGNPVNFYHDRAYQMFGSALHLLFMSWLGIRYGDKSGIFWGADRDFGEPSFREKMFAAVNRIHALNSFNVSKEKLDSFLRELERFGPTYIYGYASSLAFAAERVIKLGLNGIRPKAVRSSAEMLYESQRSLIEKAFGCKVFNFYGSREVNNLAAECEAHEGLHVMASGRIIEVVDDDGHQLPDGEEGNLAVTDLTNFSFPFIRYKTGDRGTLKKRPCSCGRSYPLLESLAGRSSDILCFNNVHIHGEYFTHLFYARPEVKQFQVVQEASDLLILRIVPQSDSIDTESLEKLVRDKVGDDVRIEVELLDYIKPLKSGKFRFTINNMKDAPAK